MDDVTRKRERRALSAQENQNKRLKVQYSPSRWPSSSSESEEFYVPKVLAASDLPQGVTENEVKDFFKHGVKNVEVFIDDKDKNNIVFHSTISFFSAKAATKGLKRDGEMLRGKSISVMRQKNRREIVSVSGFAGQAKEDMKKKLRTALKPYGKVLIIFLPKDSTTDRCLGLGYIYMNFEGKTKLTDEKITISGLEVHVRSCTMRKSYLCELLGKKNVSKTEKTHLKKLLPISDGLHNLSAKAFSWEDTRPRIISKNVDQELDDCWVVALTSHYNSLVKLSKSEDLLTINQLKKGMGPSYVVSTKGIKRLRVVEPFMRSLDCDMHVRHRPMGDGVEVFEDFEKFIEGLLKEGPAAVVVECTPGFEDFSGKGIYLPTDIDIYRITFEKFGMHCLLLTGYGVEDGKQYWQLQDFQGQNWGDRGFIKMERHKCLIKSVVELKIKD